MKIKKSILTSIAVLCCITMSAQKITFDKSVINTGSTIWKQPVTATFKFTNKGKNPLTIKSVDAGCGCLSTKWTDGTFEKGQSGEIKITYDAKQLGHYDRIIEVFTNLSDEPEYIRVKGVIGVGKLQTFADNYPFCVDDIYLSTNSVEFKEVTKRDSTSATIEIYNGSQEVYTPTLMHLPPYITAQAEPEMLARGRKGKITLTLHGEKLNDLGLNQTNIYLARFAGDKVGSDNEINVSGILLPEDNWSKQNSPRAVFDISTTELNLGKIGNKKQVSGTIKITNKGAVPLKIDRIQAFNPAITVSLQQSEIQPGQSVKMKVTLQAKYLEMSKAQPRILIFTNDYKHPMEIVTVKFEQ